MSIAPVVLKAAEYTITMTFCGADVGVFPASIPANPAQTFKANECGFVSGEQFVDFSAGMDITELQRLVKSAPALRISGPLRVPNAIIAQYQTNGPLVQVVVTGDSLVDGAGANLTLTHKGIMARPDMNFLNNPGTVEFMINPYGVEPTLVQVGL